PPALSLEGIAERRSLLAFAAIAAGVQVPRFLAGVPSGPDTIVLVYEEPGGTPFTDPTDEQIADLWANLAKLHTARMTHRGLTAESIRIDDEGRVLLPIPSDGAVFASELRISLDRAQALIITAQLVGVERAVRQARAALGPDQLAATVPLLQPIALPAAIRSAVKRDSTLLSSIRDEIQGPARAPIPETIRVERFRPRTVISFVAVVVAGYLLVGQLSSVKLSTVFSTAHWQWVPFVVLASAATYFAAALCLTGYVTEKLSYTRTVLVQLAASFVGFVAPPSVGGLALNIRYLRKADLSPTAAATSVGMSQAVNAIFHSVLLIILATAPGVASPHSLPVPGWAFVALGVLALLVLLLLAIPAPRRWILARALPTVREAIPRLIDLVTSPRKLAEATAGAVLLNACYVAALWFAARAFGGHLSVVVVAVVYLASAAVASVAPTPGGLGAVELALSTGLVGAGMPSAAAVSAVLLFRLATFWLPVPAGWAALQLLQRRAAL
ncbi:MAG: flippase-like domain-containing protein, partial [Actinobacteria bacterium]|nr:flippase-like domain-containing protein [Actinomycetota bacterium]